MTREELLKDEWVKENFGDACYPNYLEPNFESGHKIVYKKERGFLCLLSCSKYQWQACYICSGGTIFCANYDNEEPPYNKAIVFGSSPNEVLQKLYNWCVENKFL